MKVKIPRTRSCALASDWIIFQDKKEIDMDEKHMETTTWGVPRDQFDYSEIVTFSTGAGADQQFFTFDSPRLCAESSYFKERLLGDYPEAKNQHFSFPGVDPAVVACMLSWYRGWYCTLCDYNRSHIRDALRFAVDYSIPRYKGHLDKKLTALDLRYEFPMGQSRPKARGAGRRNDDSPILDHQSSEANPSDLANNEDQPHDGQHENGTSGGKDAACKNRKCYEIFEGIL